MTQPTPTQPTSPLPALAGAADWTEFIGPVPPGRDIDAHLRAVSQMIRRMCGWHIAPVLTEAMTLDGPGGRVLQLPSIHVVDVVDVKFKDRLYDGTAHWAGVDEFSYDWSTSGLLERPHGWPRRYRAITAMVTHGFALDDVRDLRRLVCLIASRAIAAPKGALRESAGGVSIEYSPDMVYQSERTLLDPFKVRGGRA